MNDSSFGCVDRADEARAYATLVSAFTDDPVERWLYPEPERYLEHFPRFVAAFGSRAFDTETVWGLDNCSAVALWMPPGTEPDGDAIGGVLTETVARAKHADTFSVLEQMDAAHPTSPHWYLPWLGVDAASQGAGLGGRLMQECLGVVDASRRLAYLETPNARTIPFYERHGFAVTGEARAGTCPPITFMARAAR